MAESIPSISQRGVFLIGGYEPKSSDAFFKRTRRELERFCQTWGVSAEMGKQSLTADGLVAVAQVKSQIQDVPVTTDLHFFVWNDIVLGDFRQPTLTRVSKYVRTFVDYVVSGTFFRMARHAWRFSLYFLYPAGMLVLFSSLAWLLTNWFANLLPPASRPAAGVLLLMKVVVASLILWGLLKWSSRRWFVMHLMDLWSFSADFLRGRRMDANEHIQRFADAVVARARANHDQEILLVGHSTGGALILEIAAAALAKEPNLGCRGPTITILTVGSTALKIGLHPAATAFRQRVQTLVDAPAIQWIECQAHTDIVNFYKTNPVFAMKLSERNHEAFPQIHLVRIREMLEPEVYKRFKFNIFRVHYQFIMANSRRYAYDFFMMCCGNRSAVQTLGQSLRFRPNASCRSISPPTPVIFSEVKNDDTSNCKISLGGGHCCLVRHPLPPSAPRS